MGSRGYGCSIRWDYIDRVFRNTTMFNCIWYLALYNKLGGKKMPRANEAELAKSIAEPGGVGFYPYKNEGLQLKVHYNSVFLDETGAMEILLNCIQNGRKVFGKQFGMDLVDYLLLSQPKEQK